MKEATTYDVILPAAGRISGEFAAETGTEVKALIELAGQTVIERTLEAVRATGRVARVVVVGPAELTGHPSVRSADVVLPEGASAPDNVFQALEWLRSDCGQHSPRVLIVTTDLPFLNATALTQFIESCPPEPDVCLPVIDRHAFEARFPGSVNEYVRLRDGEWTLGCAMLVRPQVVAGNRLYLERVFAARKSQLGMAMLLGMPFIIRFLTGRLTVEHIERRAGQLIRATGVAIEGCSPDLAYDIDRIEHYHYARQQLEGQH